MLRRLLMAIVQGCYKRSALGLRKDYSFVRYMMYTRLHNSFRAISPKTGSVLSISHSTALCKVLGLEDVTITEANYPEANILCLPYDDNTFDWVLSDQVFEHIQGDPQTAIDETFRVLKPGGYMVHTTCFLLPYH